MDLDSALALLVGIALGAALGILAMRARHAERLAAIEVERRAAEERAAAAERAREHLAEEVDGRRSLEVLVAPLRDTLDKVEGRLREIEQARVAAQTALAHQVETVRSAGEQLRRETAALVSALRKPQVRGQWGEMHLRRAVELAGLVDRCDFHTQTTVAGDDGVLRPDMVVHLAGGKHVVVDAKVSLAAFLEAAESDDDRVRAERLAAHARHLRAHVDTLAGKAYWQRLPSTPEFVVLFVPGEAFLGQALDSDPTLLEHAATRKVVVATPTTLIALLRTVAYAWSQEALAENAREVFELGRELYVRLGAFGDHVDKLGRALTTAVGSYNRAVGSLESRVLVTARRLRDLKVVDDDLAAPRAVEEAPRALSAGELVTAAEEGARIRAVGDESHGG